MTKIKPLKITQQSEPINRTAFVGKHIGVSLWRARGLMSHPNFPKAITKRTEKYNRGQWKA